MAGLQSNVYRSDAIYRAMRRYGKFPETVFRGEAADVATLRARIEAQP